MIRALLAAAALCAAALAHATPSLPVALSSELPMLKPLGEGRLRWFGLHVYDSSLWAPGGAWSFDRPFALDIRYAMSIRGRDLTKRSLEEMKKLGFADPAKGKTAAQGMPVHRGNYRLWKIFHLIPYVLSPLQKIHGVIITETAGEVRTGTEAFVA